MCHTKEKKFEFVIRAKYICDNLISQQKEKKLCSNKPSVIDYRKSNDSWSTINRLSAYALTDTSVDMLFGSDSLLNPDNGVNH